MRLFTNTATTIACICICHNGNGCRQDSRRTKHQMHNLTGLHSSGVPASLSYPGVTLLLKKWVSLQWKTPPSGHTDWYLSGAGFGLRHILNLTLTLRGRLYRRRYQLVFFKTSAKDIKNTPSILVVQISVIHQLKLWSVYFFCVHSRIQQNFVVLEKKKENKQDALLSSPSPRAALQKTSLKWTVTQRKLNTRTWELYL